MTEDPRGRQIPEFLTALAEHLGAEQAALIEELQQLVKHIDHIKQIVSMQQNLRQRCRRRRIRQPAAAD